MASKVVHPRTRGLLRLIPCKPRACQDGHSKLPILNGYDDGGVVMAVAIGIGCHWGTHWVE